MSLAQFAPILLGKLIVLFIIYSYFKRKRQKAGERSAEALERMQIREYGRKINEQTRLKTR